MAEKLTKSIFSENLNSKFRIHPGTSDPVETELVEFFEDNSVPTQEQFAVVFRGPLDTFLPQGIYRMEHDRVGTFDLFLVPIRKDQGGFYYEAVFNRFLEQK